MFVTLVQILTHFLPFYLKFSFQNMLKQNYVELHRALTANFFILQLCFSFCYLGDQMTSKALEVNESIYSCEWYTYPTKTKMLLILIMKRAQKPFVLSGYSLVDLSLKSFKEVRIQFHEQDTNLHKRILFIIYTDEQFYSDGISVSG